MLNSWIYVKILRESKLSLKTLKGKVHGKVTLCRVIAVLQCLQKIAILNSAKCDNSIHDFCITIGRVMNGSPKDFCVIWDSGVGNVLVCPESEDWLWQGPEPSIYEFLATIFGVNRLFIHVRTEQSSVGGFPRLQETKLIDVFGKQFFVWWWSWEVLILHPRGVYCG